MNPSFAVDVDAGDITHTIVSQPRMHGAIVFRKPKEEQVELSLVIIKNIVKDADARVIMSVTVMQPHIYVDIDSMMKMSHNTSKSQ